MTGILLPKTTSEPDSVVPDSRMEQVWNLLQGRWGDHKVQFANFRQPPFIQDGKMYPEGVMFVVVSPWPNRPDSLLKTPAYTPMQAWKEAEDDRWRYVGVEDPLYRVFSRLVNEHLEKLQTLDTIKGADEL